MHRAKEFMKDSAEFILTQMGELGEIKDPYQMTQVAEMCEGFNEMYEFLCNASELEDVDYDMEEGGEHTQGAKHMRYAHKMNADHMDARHRRAEHYEGEMVGVDEHGNKVRYEGKAEVHKNLR